jgi:hypothetical protein
MATAPSRDRPPTSASRSAKETGEAAAEEVGWRRFAGLGMELVRRKSPVSSRLQSHSRASHGHPASHEGDGCSLESPAAEAAPV